MMDHNNQMTNVSGETRPDMQYLTKPRGKGYSLRMTTPEALIGSINPWTGKPFGKEIKLGLNTRRHTEAIRLRDIRLGQIRQLEADALTGAGRKSVGSIIDLSPENAAEWRQMRAEASDPDALDHVLTSKLEQAEKEGAGNKAKRFADIVFKGALPLEQALENYLKERSAGNPYGYDPLAKTTALNVRSSVKHLIAFLGGDSPTLYDVTPEKAHQFRTDYLPHKAKVRSPTVAKHMTLLRGMWTWAISDKKYLKRRNGKPFANPWVVEERGTPKKQAAKPKAEDARTAFSPEEVTKLLLGFPEWGSRQGDLMRLALATGCRVDEIGALKLRDVAKDGTGFQVTKGKTANACRFVPLVEDAQRLLRQRIEQVQAAQADIVPEEQRLFPEWPLKPSTQKVNSASQWFTRYRRETLGKETDGRLALHSFRHTWRTTARRAGVPEDRIHELGGWEGSKNTSRVYDHGLTEQQLREVQGEVWAAYQAAGYLTAFG